MLKSRGNSRLIRGERRGKIDCYGCEVTYGFQVEDDHERSLDLVGRMLGCCRGVAARVELGRGGTARLFRRGGLFPLFFVPFLFYFLFFFQNLIQTDSRPFEII